MVDDQWGVSEPVDSAVEAEDPAPVAEEPQAAAPVKPELRWPDPSHLVDGVHPYPLSQPLPPETIT